MADKEWISRFARPAKGGPDARKIVGEKGANFVKLYTTYPDINAALRHERRNVRLADGEVYKTDAVEEEMNQALEKLQPAFGTGKTMLFRGLPGEATREHQQKSGRPMFQENVDFANPAYSSYSQGEHIAARYARGGLPGANQNSYPDLPGTIEQCVAESAVSIAQFSTIPMLREAVLPSKKMVTTLFTGFDPRNNLVRILNEERRGSANTSTPRVTDITDLSSPVSAQQKALLVKWAKTLEEMSNDKPLSEAAQRTRFANNLVNVLSIFTPYDVARRIAPAKSELRAALLNTVPFKPSQCMKILQKYTKALEVPSKKDELRKALNVLFIPVARLYPELYARHAKRQWHQLGFLGKKQEIEETILKSGRTPPLTELQARVLIEANLERIADPMLRKEMEAYFARELEHISPFGYFGQTLNALDVLTHRYERISKPHGLLGIVASFVQSRPESERAAIRDGLKEMVDQLRKDVRAVVHPAEDPRAFLSAENIISEMLRVVGDETPFDYESLHNELKNAIESPADGPLAVKKFMPVLERHLDTLDLNSLNADLEKWGMAHRLDMLGRRFSRLDLEGKMEILPILKNAVSNLDASAYADEREQFRTMLNQFESDMASAVSSSALR